MRIFFAFIFFLLLLSSCGNFIETRATLEANKLNQKGLAYQNYGNLDSAIFYYRAALALKTIDDESKAVILRNMGNAYSDAIENDSAKEIYMRILPLVEQESYFRLVVQSDIDLINGNIDRALRQLEKAAQMPEVDLACYNLLGLIYLGSFDSIHYDVEKAIKYNRKAMQVDNGNITVWLLMWSYYENEEYDNAYRLAKELYQRDPNNEDYLHAMATLAFEVGDEDEAKEYAGQLHQIDSAYYSDLNYILYP